MAGDEGGPLRHSGDIGAYLQELGVTEATGQDLERLLQGALTVADYSSLVPPPLVPFAGARLSSAPGAGLFAAIEVHVTPPAKGFHVVFLQAVTTLRMRTLVTTAITAGLAIAVPDFAPGGVGNLVFSTGTAPAAPGSATTIEIPGTFDWPVPFFVPVGQVLSFGSTAAAGARTLMVVAQEVP